MSKRVAPSLGCGYFLVGLIALGGGACLFLAFRRLVESGRPAATPAVWAPAAIGAGLLVAAWLYARLARRHVREHAEEDRRRAAHPDEPWLWRREWLGPHLDSDDHQGLWVVCGFALVWNALSLPAVVHFVRHPPRDKLAWLVFLFPLVGLGLVGVAIHQAMRARKYGRSRFVPVSLPGVIGGHLGGVVRVPARVAATGDLILALRCIRKKVTGAGKNRRVVETVLWQTEQRLPPGRFSSGPGGAEIPVLFEIPCGPPSTDLDDTDDQIVWRLTAEAATPGVDFFTRFHPPVFTVPGRTATQANAAPDAI